MASNFLLWQMLIRKVQKIGVIRRNPTGGTVQSKQ
jgi:hypothetical protein